MKSIIILLAVLLLTGCSAIWEADYLAPVPAKGALNVELYDWETEIYGGPSVGSYRPEIYGYKLNDIYWFVYPREISNSGSIGPVLVPLGFDIPEVNNDKRSLFEIRIFDRKNKYELIPTKLSLISNNKLQISCDLLQAERDLVGMKFICNEQIEFPINNPTNIIINFNDMSTQKLSVKLVTVKGYSPLFSFNGPDPKPKIIIQDEGKVITHPSGK